MMSICSVILCKLITDGYTINPATVS